MGGRLVSCWPRWLALAAALTVLTAAPTFAQLTDPVGPGQSVSVPVPMCPAISSNCYMQALFTNQVLPGTPARCGPFPGCTYGERYFFPFRPIVVSPIGLTDFFSEWGAAVIKSELLWVWLPASLVVALVLILRLWARDKAGSRGV